MNLLKAALSKMMAPPERKLFAAGMTGLAIAGGFVLVVFKIDAKGSPGDVIDAYKTACEWLVYLFAAFGGTNALTWWTKRGENGSTQKPSAPPPTTPSPKP